MRYHFIRQQSPYYPVTLLCRVMRVSGSAYYEWKKCPAKLITVQKLHLYRRAKALFKASRNSLGSRELSKKLCEEGFGIGRYATRTLMRKLNLRVRQRVKHKVTTRCKHSDRVAVNLLNQQFNPVGISFSRGNVRSS